MNTLSSNGVEAVFHYAPLHYLQFICRSQSLLSKPRMRELGFADTHFRSKSRGQDEARGFGGYIHLTTHESPPILQAKLAAGFPHVCLRIPVSTLDRVEFHLCRFNIAMTRKLRRGTKPGFSESPRNGRYYGERQIPIATTEGEMLQMLAHFDESKSMIEVLVPGALALPLDVVVRCFDTQEMEIAAQVVRDEGAPWRLEVVAPVHAYVPNAEYTAAIADFIEKASKDRDWRGNGLEFDKV